MVHAGLFLTLPWKQSRLRMRVTGLTFLRFDLIKQLPDLKKECVWLKEINSQSLQQSIVNLDTAFTKFFKGQANFPNFKKKTATQSFSIPQKEFAFLGQRNPLSGAIN